MMGEGGVGYSNPSDFVESEGTTILSKNTRHGINW